MKIIIETASHNTYFVPLPNYFNSDNLEETMKEVSYDIPTGEEVTKYYLHSDDITNEERKQIDYYGCIKYPLIPLNINV